ncbi:MAG: hypothetical protein K6T34_10915 [Thermoflavifilum sp.]|nr:hypothetical protein [Thermoflavifilum sp.]
MKYNPNIHHRRSIRLKGYDYSQAGACFITICTQNRLCLLGNVVNEKMVLNDAGRMIENWYFQLENKFPDILCDEYVIMPNHFHAIIINVGADLRVCPDQMGEHTGSPLPRVVQWFKTMTTHDYIRGVKQHGWQPFAGKLWQRNYWERIIRDENELTRIRQYILHNPIHWEMDKNYGRE